MGIGVFAMLRSAGRPAIAETRKRAAILIADIIGHSRLAGAEEERTLALI
jgi:hypothetical protein